MKKYFENDEILGVLWRWRKPLIGVLLLAIAGSALFSSPMFIKPKYKSYAQVYPTNLKKYSEESPTEQMIQMLESNTIREKICEKFQLDTLYEIEKDDPHFRDLLYKEYADHVQFKKTKYESVEIVALSTSPEVACNMVKSIINLFNIEMKRLHDEKLVEAMETVHDKMDRKKGEVDQLEARLNILRNNYGILDYKSQVKNLSKEYYKLLARGSKDQSKITKVKDELHNLEKYGVEYENLTNRLWVIRDAYNGLKLQYEDHVNELSRKKEYVVDPVTPYKADKKTYPVRWLIVLVSAAIAMAGSLGVVSFLDRFERKNVA